MSEPWLHVVGIGEDGMAGLAPAARALVEGAEIIVGGDRHHRLSGRITAKRIAWPSPFNAVIDLLKSYRGRRLVVLATGDPLWYSVGARIGRALAREDVAYHPQLSAFQLAACRLGWSIPDVETLTVHGRPAEQILPYFAPGARLLVLAKDRSTPKTVAELLCAKGYGQSRMVALAHMGGADESRLEGVASRWNGEIPDFHTLAIECQLDRDAVFLPRCPGLPDDAYLHDGKLTKRELRAAALAKLAPVRGGLLWDIGVGCGSIAIEWMRSAPEALAIGVEPDAKRRMAAAHNALRLGTPKLTLIAGEAPGALEGLDRPDAVFIGGGLSEEVFCRAYGALKPGGRLVAHAVTLESEGILLALFKEHGGELSRIAVQRASAVGSFQGWRPLMPVTQWAITRL